MNSESDASLIEHVGTVRRYRSGCRCRCCVAAMRERNRAYRETNPEKVKSAQQRRDLARKHDLTPEQLEDLIAMQAGACAICRLPFPPSADRGKRVHVDHCHRTGKIRGVLCANCNTGLGQFGDTAAGMYRGYLYVKTFEVFGRYLPMPRPGSSRVLHEHDDGVWLAEYYDRLGQRVCMSTRTKDIDEARTWFEQLAIDGERFHYELSKEQTP